MLRMLFAPLMLTLGLMTPIAGLAQNLQPGMELHGAAQVSDGDSLRIGDFRVRLLGIDAPELDQICKTNDGAFIPCGEIARDILADFIEGEPISCYIASIDRFGRGVGECFSVSGSLNSAMTAEGWAIALPRYSTQFVAQAQMAEQARAGIWNTYFHSPSDWRRGARW